MKLFVLLLLVPLWAGCTAHTKAGHVRAILQPSATVTLAWDQNYVYTNEETVIISSTNLALPLCQWPVVFVGSTNQCVIARTSDAAFFGAYNICTN